MKNNWKAVLSKGENFFKRYKTDNETELPNRAKFTGDEFPSSGDGAKAELDAWQEGNKLFKQDVKRENKKLDYGTPLLKDENVKRDAVTDRARSEYVKPSYAGKKKSWREVLADVSFKQKPDGLVTIDVTTPGKAPSTFPVPTDDIALESQVPEEGEEKQQPQKASSKEKTWTIKKEAGLELLGKECGTCVGAAIVKNGEVLEQVKMQKLGKTWRELINQASWEEEFQRLLQGEK